MTRHPCAGLAQSTIEVFEAIAIGQTPPPRPVAIRTLLKRGLIECTGQREFHRDRFGVIMVPDYAVPLPVHMQWCQWCDETLPDDFNDG